MIQGKKYYEGQFLDLPSPIKDSKFSLEKALSLRKSVRQYRDVFLSEQEIAQILWAAYGFSNGRRVVPSAGAIYPLSIYLFARKVEGLEAGVYRYFPKEEQLSEPVFGDISKEFFENTYGQHFIVEAAAVLAIAVRLKDIWEKYGKDGNVYGYMEAGHVSQNVYLQCVSLGVGTVAVGAFDEEGIRNLFNISENELVLYLMPLGKPI